jgi:chromosomal replication initiation ATPase DnaA
MSEQAIESYAPRTPFLPVLQAIADDYGVTLADMRGLKRTRNVTRARHAAMHYLSKRRGWSLGEIGKYFGERHHSSVLYGVRKHNVGLHAKPECD